MALRAREIAPTGSGEALKGGEQALNRESLKGNKCGKS